ncbi:NifU family protein [Mycoplasmoides pirum]|uniref:NifU family protein n=1 Tax=Mycoplasmoides pirum TaxID=2122 RepID=UPI0006962076|nr:NifU family protein [Mycoplasmoides pirum]
MKKKKTNREIISNVKDVLDNIRFYIQKDGGDLKFVSYKNGVVTIELLGACVGCALIDITYKEGVENILKDEVKEIKKLIIIDPSNKK